ncbi:Hypothetical predicted protein [Mytilus galloprovincialis]|uniref:DUF6589 domain-containing protein n=1 Tax=Mytilus galloprovincialis TaxID=29158 RepID=A0A8B6E4A4_MYTGA|nr:Hypothetical predicted protein [Mytilus galloprovincialis]
MTTLLPKLLPATPSPSPLSSQLITDVRRGVSERLGHQLVRNKTVNLKGDNNTNIEIDLQMEFFNRGFKESIKDAGGNVTDTTIARHSEMVGVSKKQSKMRKTMALIL